MIFWWIKAERSDLEGKNLGLLRGVSIKIMSCAREVSRVWIRETMGWGAWVFDSAVRAEKGNPWL